MYAAGKFCIIVRPNDDTTTVTRINGICNHRTRENSVLGVGKRIVSSQIIATDQNLAASRRSGSVDYTGIIDGFANNCDRSSSRIGRDVNRARIAGRTSKETGQIQSDLTAGCFADFNHRIPGQKSGVTPGHDQISLVHDFSSNQSGEFFRIDGPKIDYGGFGVACEMKVAGQKVGVCNIQSGSDQCVNVYLSVTSEKYTIGVDEV